MIPIFQEKYGVNGDCLRAAVASILHLSLEFVPHFLPTAEGSDAGGSQTSQLREWLTKRGLCLVEVQWPVTFCDGSIDPRVPALVTVRSPLGKNYTHAVVGSLEQRDGKVWCNVVHDPLGGIRTAYEVISVGFFAPLWPAALNPEWVKLHELDNATLRLPPMQPPLPSER